MNKKYVIFLKRTDYLTNQSNSKNLLSSNQIKLELKNLQFEVSLGWNLAMFNPKQPTEVEAQIGIRGEN